MRKDPSEPVAKLRHVPIVECGEPLVDFRQACPGLRLEPPRFHYRRETLIRAGVAQRLCEAAARLPQGYSLGIIEGWRAPIIQARMFAAVRARFRQDHPRWSEKRLDRTTERFSAPMDLEVPPPHTTGGAVDLVLHGPDGLPCDMHTPFEFHEVLGFPFDAPGLSETARTHRAILNEALVPTGLTNYPSEYWHWSYGDQGWAYRGGHSAAIYGAIEPEGWTPDPEDVREEPLTFAF